MLRTLGWLVVGVLLAAAAYELALALGAGSIGRAPGDDVAGATGVRLVALVAMLAGAGIALVSVRRPQPVVALLAPAAAAFLLASFFTYDPYYAPTLRRYSDHGVVSLAWILVVVALALAAGALARVDARGGAVATSVALVVVVVTTVLAADGH